MQKTEKDIEKLKKSLANLFLTAPLDESERDSLLRDERVEVIQCSDEEIMLDGEHYSQALFFVLEGEAAVFKQNAHDEGREVFLKYIPANQLFGAATLFGSSGGESFYTTVRAKKKCTALLINGECVTELLLKHPPIAIEYIKFLSDKIRFLNSKIDSYTTDGAKERLMKLINSKQRDGQFTLNVSYSRLAQQLNVGRASLYRAMDELSEEGRIKRINKIIYITEKKDEKD